jgi:phage N-6-adenine-methyltransferase
MPMPRKHANDAAKMRAYRLRLRRAAKAAKRCGKQNWGTPLSLFEPLHKEFGFTLDVCAEAENAKLPNYFDIAKDGLAQDWTGVCWCNMPYNNQAPWLKKAHETAKAGKATVVCLVRVDTSTKWWFEYCWSHAAEIRYITRRVKFVDTGAAVKRNGSPDFANAIIVFHPNFSGERKDSFIDTNWIIIFCVTALPLRFRR